MKNINIILEGYFKGQKLYDSNDNRITVMENIFSSTYSEITKDVVLNYEVINQQSSTSATSAAIKGSLGAFFLGTPGMMAGLSANTNEIFWVAVEWANHQKSLLQLDRELYNKFIRIMF